MSQAAGRRLRDRMFEDWIVFTDEQLAENWNRDQFAAVMDYVKQNEMPKFETWLTEWCEQNGHDFAAIKASAREQNKQDPNYQLYVTASEMYTNELERIVDEAIDIYPHKRSILQLLFQMIYIMRINGTVKYNHIIPSVLSRFYKAMLLIHIGGI